MNFKRDRDLHDGFTSKPRIMLLTLLGVLFAASTGCVQIDWGGSEQRQAQAPEPVQSQPSKTASLAAENLPETGGTPVPTLPISQTEPLAAEVISPTVNIPNLEALERQMLDLVNQDRQDHGLDPVAWDPFAARVAQAHATEMAINDYLSHWNRAGRGPDVRFALSGGQDAILENVYAYWQRYANGTPAPVQDWQELVRTAERELMNSSGHRKTILDAGNTHVGIGMAYNPETGEFRLVQDFVHHHLDQEPLPETARPGDVLQVQGRLLDGATDPLINLDYEPFPQPMTVDELAQTDEYQSPAVFILAETPRVSADQSYSAEVTIPLGSQPGYYHVRTWVSVNGNEVLAGDMIVAVEAKP